MWLGRVGHKRGVSPDKGEAGVGTSLRLDRYVIAIQQIPFPTALSIDLLISGLYPFINPSSSWSDERRDSAYTDIVS